MGAIPKDIEIISQFSLIARERGKIVPGSLREGHNVFTTVGSDWLSKLVAWQTIDTPDIPFTQRRVRWVGVGTGTQAETVNVTVLNAPALVTPTFYLGAVQAATFPATGKVKFFKEFLGNEISMPAQGLAVVPLTEATLYADVFPVSAAGGTLDAATGSYDTQMNPEIGTNPCIAYKTFQVLNKTVDFNVEVRWEFSF
jgi:hypothetical protein